MRGIALRHGLSHRCRDPHAQVLLPHYGGADEISSYVLAVSCSWGFGFALIRKGHVRIDILYRRFPAGVRFSLDLLSLALFLLYLLTLCYFAWLVLKTSFVKHSLANTPLQTPLWIPQGLWFLGLVVFAMVILLLLVGTLYHLVQGDFKAAQRLSGLSVSDRGRAEKGHASLDGGER